MFMAKKKPADDGYESLRARVVTELTTNALDDPPTTTEAIGELNEAVHKWSRLTGLYDLMCDLREEIPMHTRQFPILDLTGDEKKRFVIDPASWTEKDQLALIDLILGNLTNDYHKQLGGLADAAVTSVAAIAYDNSGDGAEPEPV